MSASTGSPRTAVALALAAAVLAAPFARGSVPRAQGAPPSAASADLDAAVARLGSGSEAERRGALEALRAAGRAGAERALAGFEGAPPEARRLRASVARAVAGEAALERALALVDDPDPRVRRPLLELLGRGDLAERAPERASVLERFAREDADAGARETALEGLARLAAPGALEALARLVRELPAAEAERAAELLAGLPDARERVVQLVQGAFSARAGAAVQDPALGALLAGYGRALAELPGGGESSADRAPFVLGAAHPEARVRLGALRGWSAYLARNQALEQHARSAAVLERLAGEGLGAAELHFRRAYVSIADAGDAEAALESARALARGVPPGADVEELVFLFYGRYFEACARLGEGRTAAARAAFQRAGEILDGLRAERVELRPHLARPSERHAAAAVDQAVFRSLVEVGRIAALLAEGARPGAREVLEAARRAHVFAIEAQLLGVSTDAPVAVGQWDAILDDNLAPRRLVFAGRSPAFPPERSLALLVDLHRALAAVAPLELPGFAPARPDEPDPWLTDPFQDPERLALLEELLVAERGRVERRLTELLSRRAGEFVERPFGGDVRRLHLRARQLEEEIAAVEAGDTEPLRKLRVASDEVLVIAREQLALARPEAARELAQRALDDLEAAGIWETYYFKQSFAARLEMLIGSSHMDEGEADEAERAYLRALARHEGLENAYRQAMREAAGEDEAQRAAYEAQIEQVRLDRSNVLVSLAVNANVRQRDPQKALEYFERAYELQKNDFMQVLLACYHARSGRDEEARAELRQVPVSPALYYNLACTYALMGDTDRALDYLAREFAENHPEQASLERQRAWARGDPDLASLRGDPRFERLVDPE